MPSWLMSTTDTSDGSTRDQLATHFGAEPPPDAAELQADHARAEHAEALRHVRDGERAVVIEDELVVDGEQHEDAAVGRP